MQILTASAGSYPRIGDAPRTQRWRRAYAAFEVGAIAETTFRTVEDQVAADIIAEQTAIGLDVVTDGLVRWYDPISHTARKLGGVTINGLLRYFDNNFYVRQPVIRDRIARTTSIVAAEYRFAARKTPRAVKAVLTGPYTLARHSVIATPHYPDVAALTLAFADVLALEIDELQAAGAAHVQLDEPAIARTPGDFPLLIDAVGRIAAQKVNVELTLAVFFADVAGLLPQLESVPVDVVALDVPASPTLMAALASTPIRQRLALGLVDGRNTRLEDVSQLARIVEPILSRTNGPLYLTSSCGLEYVPQADARRKLEVLCALRRTLSGTTR